MVSLFQLPQWMFIFEEARICSFRDDWRLQEITGNYRILLEKKRNYWRQLETIY